MRWVHFLHRDMSVLFDYFAQRAGVEYLADTLKLEGFALTGRKIDHQEIYHDAEELEEFRKRVKAGGQEYLDFIVNACEEQCENLVGASKDSRKLTPLEAFDRYCLEQMKTMAFLPLFPGVIEPIIAGQLDDIVKRYASSLVPEASLAGVLEKPSKPYVVMQEEIARYRIGAMIQKDPSIEQAFLDSNDAAKAELDRHPNLRTAILQHIQSFGWVETRHFKGNSWSIDDVLTKLRQIISLDCPEEYKQSELKQEESEAAIERVYKQLNFTDADKRVIRTIRQCIYLRTQRKDAMSEATFHMQWAFDEIARQARLETPNLVYLMPHEIKDAFHNPEKSSSYQNEIEKRKKGFALITYDGVTRIFTDEFTLPTYKEKSANQVTGMSTFPGEVTARARKIMAKDEIRLTGSREIIITPTTSPDYSSIIQDIAGIITNEGGITCHAAQISREYRIPCITGVGNATDVFKTGDTVYLNATKGFAEVKEK